MGTNSNPDSRPSGFLPAGTRVICTRCHPYSQGLARDAYVCLENVDGKRRGASRPCLVSTVQFSIMCSWKNKSTWGQVCTTWTVLCVSKFACCCYHLNFVILFIIMSNVYWYYTSSSEFFFAVWPSLCKSISFFSVNSLFINKCCYRQD